MHIIVGTPGRLSDLIKRQKISLGLLDLLVLDGSERILDPAFEEQLVQIFGAMEVRTFLLKFILLRISKGKKTDNNVIKDIINKS